MTIQNQIDLKLDINKGDFKLDVELSIPGNGITVLFGPSGVGKTSLVRTIAGLDHYPDSFISVNNVVWQDKTTYVSTHQRRIGYVFQEANLFEHLNVRENLEYGIKRFSNTHQNYGLSRLIEMMGLTDLVERNTQTLSGGERQRVAITRSLAINPTLLLMDEPLASLDDYSKEAILPYIDKAHKELSMPIIYVTHSAIEAARVSDHMVLLDKQGVQAAGPTQQVLTQLDLPLASNEDAASIIEANVVDHDEHYQLSCLNFSGGQLYVANCKQIAGSIVRFRVAASDVSLTLNKQTDTSILNILKATIDQLIVGDNGQTIVRLKLGNELILSRITNKSAGLLNLHVGKIVYAQIKSVALLS